ncbi:hypothetical protein HAX54_031266 [Datura stramonium]|uniref:Uncharacterized protein n=1 Tax=Datura stramonium TaxID=4076 RepID=A0ABS8SBX0_DATST|nr:hypothetical protein [Datura stramonium]
MNHLIFFSFSRSSRSSTWAWDDEATAPCKNSRFTTVVLDDAPHWSGLGNPPSNSRIAAKPVSISWKGPIGLEELAPSPPGPSLLSSKSAFLFFLPFLGLPFTLKGLKANRFCGRETVAVEKHRWSSQVCSSDMSDVSIPMRVKISRVPNKGILMNEYDNMRVVAAICDMGYSWGMQQTRDLMGRFEYENN